MAFRPILVHFDTSIAIHTVLNCVLFSTLWGYFYPYRIGQIVTILQ